MQHWLTYTQRHRFLKNGVGLWIVVTILLISGNAYRCYASDGQDTQPAALPWEVSADQVTYEQESDTYTAEGNVRISREGRVLTADMVRLNQKNQQAWAEGNVRLLSGLDRLTGRSMQLDLANETGALFGGTLFLSDNHMYVTGEQISKTGPDSYHAQNASVTTCDGDNPDWHITGKDLKVTIEGYGFAKHSTFWAKQIPVIYTPYLVFPVKLKRQSGLLAPEFGVSDRKGFEYLQPFFWAISDSTDATFFADYMAERGLRAGVEYRYVAGDRARGTFMADGFDDRRVDDGLLDHSERWGYTDDPYLRTNNGRYWLRGKIDQNLPLEMTAKVDLDVVSDQDYLQEFKSGFNGFNETQNYFLETFGRDVDDYTAQFRENQLNINRLWSRYAFNADVRWYHDAVRSRPDSSATPYQNLPEISFDGIKQKIFGSPVYYDLLSSYTHFYREQGATGQRIDMYPRVYYPTRLFNAVSVEPSAGVRQTAWHMDRHDSAAVDLDTDTYRAIYDLELDTSTDFYRVFDFDKGGIERIKHTIRPQIVYHYIPDTDQTEYPYFDSLDRIQARNLVTFALTNNLIARKPHTGAPTEGPDAVYIPFLRFRVEQGLDLDKANSDEPHPWTDLLAELDIMPGRYIRLDSDALLDPYEGRLNAFNTALRLWDARGDWISVDYRYTRETEERSKINSIITEAAWQVTHQWQLRARYERDIAGGEFEESGFGVTYQSQCWGIDVDYALEEDDNSSISARVRLTGLGSIGQ